jgi:hypothetical protein
LFTLYFGETNLLVIIPLIWRKCIWFSPWFWHSQFFSVWDPGFLHRRLYSLFLGHTWWLKYHHPSHFFKNVRFLLKSLKFPFLYFDCHWDSSVLFWHRCFYVHFFGKNKSHSLFISALFLSSRWLAGTSPPCHFFHIWISFWKSARSFVVCNIFPSSLKFLNPHQTCAAFFVLPL